MPKVSVIILVYNVEKYLRECLDSVVNQTLKDIEIICVNDGSTDNSLQILEEFAKDGNINAFIRSLQYVVKARGRGAISSLAKELNMDRSNLSDILNGKVQPKISTTLKLINGLGYKIHLKSA